MKKLRYILIILLLSSCMNTLKSKKFGIYGISDIKKKNVKGFTETTFYIHFTNNVDRFSIYYYQIIREDWVQSDVTHHMIDKWKRKSADKSVGIMVGFTSTEDVSVKIVVYAYLEVSDVESDTVSLSHVFE